MLIMDEHTEPNITFLFVLNKLTASLEIRLMQRELTKSVYVSKNEAEDSPKDVDGLGTLGIQMVQKTMEVSNVQDQKTLEVYDVLGEE